jgi:TP901 family phage tail tape measure protein
MGVISGSGGLGFGAAFTLDDKFSATSDKIEKKFGSLSGATEKASARIAGGLGKIKKGFKQLAIGGAILLPFAFAVNEAIKFETAFTGVKKTVELTQKEFKVLEGNIRSLSKSIPVSAIELSGIAEVAGQLGIQGVVNLTKFTDSVAKIGVTTNLTGEEAAIGFARIAGIINEPIENIDKMGSSVVALGNKFKTNEKEVLNFSTRIASAGNLAEISTSDVFAISAAFSSVGKTAEAGGTSVSKVLNKMTTAVATGNKDLGLFAKTAGLSKEAFKNLTPIQRFQSFVTGLGKQGKLGVTALENLGLKGEQVIGSFLALAGAGNLLNETVSESSKAFEENTALNTEAQLRFETTASKIAILKNIFIDLMVSIGEGLKPALDVLIGVLGPVIDFFGMLAKTAVGKFIISIVVAVGVLVVGLGILNIVIGEVTVASGVFMTVILPILPILLAIVAVLAVLIGTFKLVTTSLDKFKEVMAGGEIEGGFAGFMQKFGGIITGVMEIWESATSQGFSLSIQMSDALERLGILDFVLALGTWIVRIKELFSGVWNSLKPIGDNIREAFNFIKDAVTTAIDTIQGVFDKLSPTMDKNTSSVSTWTKVGEVLGKVIKFLLVPSMWILKGVMAVIGIAIVVIVTVIEAIIFAFQWLASVIAEQIDIWVTFAFTVRDTFFSVMDWLLGLPIRFYNFGVSIIDSIRQGITDAWVGLKNLITGLVSGVGDTLSEFFNFGDSDLEANINGPDASGTGQLDNINNNVATNRAASANQNVNLETGPVTAESGPITLQVEIDGDKIAEKMIEKESLNDSRS